MGCEWQIRTEVGGTVGYPAAKDDVSARQGEIAAACCGDANPVRTYVALIYMWLVG